MKKYLIPGGIALVCLLITAFGAWARVTHQPYAQTAKQVGIISLITGQLALGILLVMWLKKKK